MNKDQDVLKLLCRSTILNLTNMDQEVLMLQLFGRSDIRKGIGALIYFFSKWVQI